MRLNLYCKTTVFYFFALLCSALIFNFGCANKPAKGNLLIHAGAGFKGALDEIGKEFEKETCIKIDISYKGSGYALADITMSKEGDLFMPGEEFYLEQARKLGFISDSKTAAYFTTVIITKKGNPKGIKSVKDFAKPGIKIGAGDPKSCAIGVWHEKIFKKAGITEQVKKNTVMRAFCIPELGNAVKLNHIDASIVWNATAILYKDVIDVIPVESNYRGIIPLPVGILTFSKDRQSAEKFIEFCLSDRGQEIFHKNAFTVNPDNADEDIKWLMEEIGKSR